MQTDTLNIAQVQNRFTSDKWRIVIPLTRKQTAISLTCWKKVATKIILKNHHCSRNWPRISSAHLGQAGSSWHALISSLIPHSLDACPGGTANIFDGTLFEYLLTPHFGSPRGACKGPLLCPCLEWSLLVTLWKPTWSRNKSRLWGKETDLSVTHNTFGCITSFLYRTIKQ